MVSHVLGRAGVKGTEFHGVQEPLAKQLEKSKPEARPGYFSEPGISLVLSALLLPCEEVRSQLSSLPQGS